MSDFRPAAKKVLAKVRLWGGRRYKDVRYRAMDALDEFRAWRVRRAEDKVESAYIKLYTSAHESLLVFDKRDGVRLAYLLYVPRQVLADNFGGLYRLIPEPNRDHVIWMITWLGGGGGLALALGVVGVFMGVQLTSAFYSVLGGMALGLVGSRVIKDPSAVKPMWTAKRDNGKIYPVHPVAEIGLQAEAAAEFLYKRTNRSTVGRAIAELRRKVPDWKEAVPLGILAILNGGLAFGAYIFTTS